MLSSMFSPTKNTDKKFLLELGELVEVLVKLGTPQTLELAEKFAQYYLELENKIQSHDYTNDDRIFDQLNNTLWTLSTPKTPTDKKSTLLFGDQK